MKKDDKLMLTARVPHALVKKIDKAAKQAQRSRSAEIRMRLEAAFRQGRARSAA